MRHDPKGETVLYGMLDQAALQEVFVKIRDLGLTLISVNRVEATETSHPSAKSERFQTKGNMKNE